jgi:ribonuclease P protein component
LEKPKAGYKKRLKSKKTTEKIFNSGRIVFSSDKKIRAHYFLKEDLVEFGIMSSVAVSKKAGKAVWRNRAKRLIRESYRLNSDSILASCRKEKIRLEIIFAVNSISEKADKKISLKDIQPSIIEILNSVKMEIEGSSKIGDY